LHRAAELLKVPVLEVAGGVTRLTEHRRELRRAIESGGKLQPAPSKQPTTRGVEKAGAAGDEAIKQALGDAARLLSVAPLGVCERIESLLAEVASLEQRLAQRDEAGPLSADSLLQNASNVGGVTVVIAQLPGVEPGLMRQLIDQIRQKAAPAAVLLATPQGDDKVTLVAGISKDLQQRGVSAGNWIRPVAEAVGGGGGGRPDLAQAGGKHPEKLPEALETARRTIAEMVSG
jgi:alanyl-tRNA synthetase